MPCSRAWEACKPPQHGLSGILGKVTVADMTDPAIWYSGPPPCPWYVQVGEDTAALLLPTIAAGVAGAASPDFRAAAYMIASQLAARAPLAPNFLDGEHLI